MGRWTQHDEDSSRLPAGMQRIGYDADTQQYTFRDTDRSIWRSAPGCEYGRLTRVETQDHSHMFFDPDAEPSQALLAQERRDQDRCFDDLAKDQAIERDIKSSWRLMAPFLLIVCLIPVLVWRFIGSGSGITYSPPVRRCETSLAEPVVIKQGDTCWDLAERHDMSVNELQTLNDGIVCERLRIGDVICVRRAATG